MSLNQFGNVSYQMASLVSSWRPQKWESPSCFVFGLGAGSSKASFESGRCCWEFLLEAANRAKCFLNNSLWKWWERLICGGYINNSSDRWMGRLPWSGDAVSPLLRSPCLPCRRGTLLVNNGFAILAALLLSLGERAKSYEMLVIGRFIVGVDSGKRVLPAEAACQATFAMSWIVECVVEYLGAAPFRYGLGTFLQTKTS